jgi:hypothetical protein
VLVLDEEGMFSFLSAVVSSAFVLNVRVWLLRMLLVGLGLWISLLCQIFWDRICYKPATLVDF